MLSGIAKAMVGTLVSLILVPAAVSQIDLYGVDMKSGGSVSVGYSSAFGDAGSSHGLDLGGNANINGSYYSPNFLNFNIQPYYGRSQANSAYESLTDSSGVNAQVNLFTGSHFPGSISYSANYDSTGQYGVPGSAHGLLTNGSGYGIGVGWGASFEGLPSFNVSYSHGTGDSSIYGVEGQTTTSTNSFGVNSHYSWAGFQLNGNFTHFTNEAVFPTFNPEIQGNADTSSDSNQFQFVATHLLPMRGSFNLNYSRYGFNSDYKDSASAGNAAHGTSDSLNSSVTLSPTRRFSVSAGVNYNDNLVGDYTQQVLNAGGAAPESTVGTVRSLNMIAGAGFSITQNLSASGNINHQEQFYRGDQFSYTSYGGTLAYNYSRPLFGVLSFSFGAYDSANQYGNGGLAVIANVNYDKRIGHWETSANFNYSQNVQTMIAFYTTSSYSYLAHVSRRVNDHLAWSTSYSGSHTGFEQTKDTGSYYNSLSSSLTYNRISLAGSWAKSRGQSLLTATGLIPLPGNLPPGLIEGDQVVVYGVNAYSFSVGAAPLRNLSIYGTWSKSHGDSNSLGSPISVNHNNISQGRLQYRFRKLNFDAGYVRFDQSVGTLATGSTVVSSFYFGLSRWFNFF